MPSYTKEHLAKAVATSTSYRQVLVKLGLSPQGGNSATIKRFIIKWNIDASHFLGASQRGRPKKIRQQLSTYLNNEKPCGSFRLKKRLLREKVFESVCSWCKGTQWLSQPMPLELDHIDGDTTNNQLSNLRLLCPNCHALTETYRGKNQQRVK